MGEPKTQRGLNRTCPKCRSQGAEVKHHSGIGWATGCGRDWGIRREFPGEHLHLKCPTCSYEWAEVPLDVPASREPEVAP